MKSLWKCLINSTLVILAVTGASATLLAQDAGQVGIVRISSAPIGDPTGGQIVQASAMQAGCQASAGISCPSGNCDPSMGGVNGNGVGMGDGDCRYCRRNHFGRRNGDCWDCENGGQGMGYGHGHGHGLGHCRFGHCRSGHCHGNCDDALCQYLRCKFGYFIPTGGGGQGLPWVGHYARVYPVNPYYADSRDGQVWAAQGYGIPISVPLAPVVGHTYDYGWGIPSSRLTPISRPAY